MRISWIGCAGLCLAGLVGCNNSSAPTKPNEGAKDTGAQQAQGTSTPAAPAAPAATGNKASGPLASLSGVAKALNDGMAGFLGGKEAAAAFPGWEANAKEKLRDDLKAAGVTQAVHTFMEFELIFEKAGKDVYYLRTGVWSTDSVSAFVQFSGREPEGGKIEVSSQPLDGYTGPGAPFREAADAVLKVLQGPECTKVPLATPQDIAAIVASGPLFDEMNKDITEAKGKVEPVCKAIAGLGADKVRLRIDDQTYLAKDASGTVLGAIRGGFQAQPGKIQYGLNRFRALK